MLDRLKIRIKFIMMQSEWRKKNKCNFTYLRQLCDVNKIEIGDYTYGGIDAETFGCSEAFLRIGKFCSIAKNVRFILDGEHNYHYISTYPFKVRLQGYQAEALCRGPITIGDDVWIGERATILSGVTIGQGAVIGAGEIVRKDVPPYGIFVNGEVKKFRFGKDIVTELMKLDYTNIDAGFVKDHIEYFYAPVDVKKVQELIKLIAEKG